MCFGMRFGMCFGMRFGRRLLWTEVKECWIDWNIELVDTNSLGVWDLVLREYSGPFAVSIYSTRAA